MISTCFSKLFMLSLWVFVQIQICLSTYSITGLDLYDLQETTTGAFASGWIASSLYAGATAKTAYCDGLLLLGGYKILGGIGTGEYFQMIYSGLPAHNIIYFSMVFWAIDSWDPPQGDAVELKFGTASLYGWTFPQINPGPQNVCGGSFGEIPGIILKGQVAHTGAAGSSIDFRVISRMTQDTADESFGFREIHFKFDTVATPITDSMCAITPIQMPTTQPATAQATLPVNTCSCLSTEYEYPTRTGHCYACHTDCLTCTGSSSTSCTSCQPGKYLSGTQCNPCSTDCVTCSAGDANSCVTCAVGSFLVLNKACVTSCNYPLIQTPGTIPTCSSPCTGSQFLYWDQTCSASCPSVLQQEDIKGLKLCKYQCATNQYLYWNGSCLSTCDFPLKTSVQNSRNFCIFPCLSSEYLNFDGTCTTSCPYPFLAKIESGFRYCTLRCLATQYYSWDGSCVDSCNAPFRIEPYICTFPCTDPLDYYFPNNQTCNEGCNFPFVVQKTGSYFLCVYPEIDGFFPRLFMLAPLQDGTPTLIVLIRIMHYIRYLNVTMSPRLERLAQSRGRPILSLDMGFAMPSGMQGDFVLDTLDSTFKVQKLHSQFFVNFWTEFVSLIIILIAVALFLAIEILAKRSEWKILHAIFGTLRTLVQWNFMIILLTTSIDNIILFSYLEFITFAGSMKSALAYLSFITCLIVLCSITGLIIFTLYLLCKKAPSQQGRDHNFSQKLIAFSNQYKRCGAFYLGFNISSVFGKFFFLIYLARLGVPMILAVSLRESQVAQIFLHLGINLAMLGCIIYFKPLKSRINHFQLILFELIVLVMNTCMTIITVFDIYDINVLEEGIILGDVVVIGNSVSNLLLIIFAIAKIVNEISAASAAFKPKPLEEKVSFFFQLLVIPLQQGGMGFESVFGTYSITALSTELGAEGTNLIKKKDESLNRDAVPDRVSRLTNRRIHAEVLNDSELKHRLNRAPNTVFPLNETPFNGPTIGSTNMSRLSTPFRDLNALDQLQYYPGGLNDLGLDRRASDELPSVSIMDSSMLPFVKDNNPNLSINPNNLSYDFGDLNAFDPTVTNKGVRVSASTHLTPSVVHLKAPQAREANENENDVFADKKMK